jgi:hypothetical protein
VRRVLPEYTSETLPAYLVYPSRRHLAPRTRVVIDFLIEEVHRLRSRRSNDHVPSVTTRNSGTIAREAAVSFAA